MRREIGNKVRNRTPKREKPEEKENVSAQYPIPVGITPAPRINPNKTIKETAVLLSADGKIREITVKPTGNRHAADAA